MCNDDYTLDDVFPAGRGDYSIGDNVRFNEDGQEYSGDILHVAAPGTTASGREHPTFYTVDAGDGFPHIVYASDVIVE